MLDSVWFDLGFWGSLITQGFFLGALIGAIIGSISWTVMERGSNVVFLLSVGALLGFLIGLYLEGGPLLNFVRGGTDQILGSPSLTRAIVFNSIVGILRWIFFLMGLACIVASTRRALVGVILGGLLGTIAGMTMVLLSDQFVFALDNPLTTVLIALVTTLLMVLVSLGQEG